MSPRYADGEREFAGRLLRARAPAFAGRESEGAGAVLP